MQRGWQREHPAKRPAVQKPATPVPAAVQLAGAIGNQAFTALARVPAPPKSELGSPEALADSALASSDVALISQIDLAAVGEDTRLKLIDMCNARDGDGMTPRALRALWGSFGTTLDGVGFRHWDLFARSLAIEPDLLELDAVKKLQETFVADVRAEALRRLTDGEQMVAAELTRLEAMEQLGLEQQQSETSAMQLAASQFQRAQKASYALRKIRVRGEFMGKRPDVTRTTTEWYVEPAYFDPGHRPESTTYDDPATDPWKGLPLWEEVKSYYDLLIGAMLELAAEQPFLNVAAATDTVHDVAIAPESRYILDAALEPLRSDQGAIALAKGLLTEDSVDVLGLDPVVQAVRWSTVPAASGTPWVGEFYRWIASATVHEHGSDEVKHSLRMNLGSMALIVLAEVLSDGLVTPLLIGAGIGVGAVQAAGSIDRAQDLEAMEASKLKIGDDLVAPGAAGAAEATAVVDTIIAFLNLLPLASLGRGAGAAAAETGARAVAAEGDEILQTAVRVETIAEEEGATAAGRPTAPMAIPDVPTEAPTPPRTGPGGAQPGSAPRPLNINETRDLFTKALKRPSPLTAGTSELAVDATTFEAAYRNAGGVGPLPAAFVDPVSGRVWVLIGHENSLTVFHEAVHQLSITSGARGPFLRRYGTFLEEGITEGLTREHLGPQAFAQGYDRNVNFLGMMDSRLGVSMDMLERAYLDGEFAPLEAAIRSGLGGDASLSEAFLTALREIGGTVDSAQALRDALHIMYVKALPPI